MLIQVYFLFNYLTLVICHFIVSRQNINRFFNLKLCISTNSIMCSMLSMFVACTLITLFFFCQTLSATKDKKVNVKKPEYLKPSIYFEELQLRPLCEQDEWIEQFRPIRSRWTKCLGFQKIFLPTDRNNLKRSTIKLLEKFANVADEQLNPFCR